MIRTTMTLSSVDCVNTDRFGTSFALYVYTFGGSLASIYFDELDGLKKFVEAANSLIAQEESAVAAGR